MSNTILMKKTNNDACRTISVEEMASILGIGRATGYTLANKAVVEGKPFRAVRIGGSLRVSRKSFEKFLEENDI